MNEKNANAVLYLRSSKDRHDVSIESQRHELARLAEFCLRHNLVLCSDEIHCDLILDPALPHVPTAVLSPEIAARTVTLMAPSKTYNVPGLATSFAVIPDEGLRRKFIRASAGIVAEVTTLGFAACEAAYESASQFSREYSRLFGTSPKRDVVGLRRQVGTPSNVTFS